ncbi:MAG TPA: hypothetical protein VFI23_03425 [Rhizomicrobium sp.]|nr:hypothetical protein [Rhizomicrobium sp.]
MKKISAVFACLLLAGCSDAQWDRAMNYINPLEPEDVEAAAAAAPQPQPQPAASALPANAEFCHAVATEDATSNGFDAATQQRVLARSYAQCVAIYSH